MSDDTQKADETGQPAAVAAASPATPVRRARPCPICSKLSTDKAYPFCSKRCADIDLHHWLKESYTVPVVELDDIDPSQFEE